MLNDVYVQINCCNAVYFLKGMSNCIFLLALSFARLGLLLFTVCAATRVTKSWQYIQYSYHIKQED